MEGATVREERRKQRRHSSARQIAASEAICLAVAHPPLNAKHLPLRNWQFLIANPRLGFRVTPFKTIYIKISNRE